MQVDCARAQRQAPPAMNETAGCSQPCQKRCQLDYEVVAIPAGAAKRGFENGAQRGGLNLRHKGLDCCLVFPPPAQKRVCQSQRLAWRRDWRARYAERADQQVSYLVAVLTGARTSQLAALQRKASIRDMHDVPSKVNARSSKRCKQVCVMLHLQTLAAACSLQRHPLQIQHVSAPEATLAKEGPVELILYDVLHCGPHQPAADDAILLEQRKRGVVRARLFELFHHLQTCCSWFPGHGAQKHEVLACTDNGKIPAAHSCLVATSCGFRACG